MGKAGLKYYQQIERLHEDLESNKQIYDKDDEDDRKIKMSGFYDDELEFKMSGQKLRPSSPGKKKVKLVFIQKMAEKPTFYEDIDRMYH